MPTTTLQSYCRVVLITQLCQTLCDSANCQAPLSMEFSKQEYWSGLLLPSPGIAEYFLKYIKLLSIKDANWVNSHDFFFFLLAMTFMLKIQTNYLFTMPREFLIIHRQTLEILWVQIHTKAIKQISQ